MTTKHSGFGFSISETYTGEVSRPIIQQNSSKGLISDYLSEIASANLSPHMKRVCWSTPDEQEVANIVYLPKRLVTFEVVTT